MPSSATLDNRTADVNAMLRSLSRDELECAARANYAYAVQDRPTRAFRDACARQMAERYLHSKSGDTDAALTKLRATLRFRREADIDALRRKYHPDHRNSDDPNNINNASDDAPLQTFLSNQKLYVSSNHDRCGRSTLVFVPRLVDDHSLELTRRGHLYTMERAIASSRAKDQTVNAVVDFAGFSVRTNAPPTAVGKDLMTTLRDHYVGHVNEIFLLNVPTAFYCLWSIFKPFAGKKTRAKIHFLNTERQKQQVLGSLYSKDQSSVWMQNDGKRTEEEFDVEEYLMSSFDGSSVELN